MMRTSEYDEIAVPGMEDQTACGVVDFLAAARGNGVVIAGLVADCYAVRLAELLNMQSCTGGETSFLVTQMLERIAQRGAHAKIHMRRPRCGFARSYTQMIEFEVRR